MSSFEPPEDHPEPRPEQQPEPRPEQQPEQPTPRGPQPYQPPFLPPDRPKKRFDGGFVALGIVAGFLGAPFLFFVVLTLGSTLGSLGETGATVAELLLLAAVLGPLGLASTFVSRAGSPARRGFALGYLIGVAALLVVGAGLCVAVISQLGSGNA
ncbi:MAG TPA: hypothetical protein VE781_04815 [Kineosporiaceae bacterium]|nr:hypothetical protein [Kineosporiaceae bacterium]